MKKRLLSWILALVMAFNLLPISLGEEIDFDEPLEAVAEEGGVRF